MPLQGDVVVVRWSVQSTQAYLVLTVLQDREDTSWSERLLHAPQLPLASWHEPRQRCCECFAGPCSMGHTRWDPRRLHRDLLALRICAGQSKTCSTNPRFNARPPFPMAQSSPEGGVLVRPCASPGDCEAVAALCASAFPEECRGQGLSVQQWSQIEADDLKRTPAWWRQIGEGPGRSPSAGRRATPAGGWLAARRRRRRLGWKQHSIFQVPGQPPRACSTGTVDQPEEGSRHPLAFCLHGLA